MHFSRHAGPDPASRRYRKDWIPAFAGMTTFLQTGSLWTDSNYSERLLKAVIPRSEASGDPMRLLHFVHNDT
jgi:hypothetical protein